MPNTEHVRFRFHLTQSGSGAPLLQIDYVKDMPSALTNPLKRVFFTFHENTSWDDAESLVGELNKKIQHMAVTVYALGEYM